MKKLIYIILFLSYFNVCNAQDLQERLKQHVYILSSDSLMGRKAGSVHARKAADYIVSQWEEIGITPLGESFYSPFEKIYCNLVAIIEGNDPILKNEYIIVGAHYDHLGSKIAANGNIVIYNGADDNASGVAALIELARNLKEIQSSLRRSVIFIAFDAEETGLYGSCEFSTHPPVAKDKIKLMFSIDMVGWYKASGYVRYSGYKTFKNGNQLLLGGNLIPEGLNVKTKSFEKSVFTATDTECFAKKGLPTLAVTTGLKSPYHKPTDVATLIDYEGMALITEHLTNVVKAVSQDDSFQASGKIALKHGADKKFVLGIAVNTGSNYHHYTAGALQGKSAFACGAGVNGQVNIKKFFAIRPEVYYEYVRARYPLGDIATHNITVPLNFGLRLFNTGFGFTFFIGPYYNYKFQGKQGNEYLDFKNGFNRNEIGLNVILELQISNLRIGFTSRSALTNFTLIKNADGAHIRNRTYYFTVAFTF